MLCRVLLWSGFLFLPAAATGADWTEFRGPTGQGHSAARGLPVRWSDTENVAWKRPIAGTGWSSPVVYRGRVYLTTAVAGEEESGGDYSLRALCLDAADGAALWDVEVFQQGGDDAPRIHRKNSHASPTPLVDGQQLFVHFGHQGIACLDLSGKILWRNQDLSYHPVHGNGGSPVLVEDLLVFSIDGRETTRVAALERNTGKLRWQADRHSEAVKKFSFSTPLVINVKGTRQVVSPGSDSVSAFDVRDGREIWRVRYDGYSVIPRPIFAHGLVYVCTGYNTPQLLAIRPDGTGDVTDTHLEWTVAKGAPHTPSLLMVGDELYMVSDRGVASCLDARTGDAHWQKRVDGNFSASPLYADGRIYLQSEDGVGVVIKAGKQFEELARNDLGERTLASYAVADGALFIRSDKHLYRVQK